jgi:hypothetical protein
MISPNIIRVMNSGKMIRSTGHVRANDEKLGSEFWLQSLKGRNHSK